LRTHEDLALQSELQISHALPDDVDELIESCNFLGENSVHGFLWVECVLLADELVVVLLREVSHDGVDELLKDLLEGRSCLPLIIREIFILRLLQQSTREDYRAFSWFRSYPW
jgi:hypothetical protein